MPSVMHKVTLAACALLLLSWSAGCGTARASEVPPAVRYRPCLRAAPAITPLPQCRETRGAPAAAVTLAADTPVVSDDPLAAATLTASLKQQCVGAGAPTGGAAPPPPKVLLQLPGRQQTAALAARGLQLRGALGHEGYLLDVDAAAGGVLIAAHNTSGLFHGVQTLLQSLGSPSHGQ